MLLGKSVTTLVERRVSCRTYQDRPIEPATRAQLDEFLSSPDGGPFGTPLRFKLIAAAPGDQSALKGLGTYGFIRGATGFIAGTAREGERDLEDFGYRMEQIVLLATALDLGTCWLGGTFSRSRFAAALEVAPGEQFPAVVALGYAADQRGLVDRFVRRQAAGDRRTGWDRLFFDRQFGIPLGREAAGAYAGPLEMVRLAPSASNKQPWRIIRDGAAWHFYVQRTRGYRQRNAQLFQVADMQRIDIGIAMCHFEMSAREQGLGGRWVLDEPPLVRLDDLTEYRATWREDAAD